MELKEWYSSQKKSEIENKYVAPLSEDVKVIYSKIKELMQYY